MKTRSERAGLNTRPNPKGIKTRERDAMSASDPILVDVYIGYVRNLDLMCATAGHVFYIVLNGHLRSIARAGFTVPVHVAFRSYRNICIPCRLPIGP